MTTLVTPERVSIINNLKSIIISDYTLTKADKLNNNNLYLVLFKSPKYRDINILLTYDELNEIRSFILESY